MDFEDFFFRAHFVCVRFADTEWFLSLFGIFLHHIVQYCWLIGRWMLCFLSVVVFHVATLLTKDKCTHKIVDTYTRTKTIFFFLQIYAAHNGIINGCWFLCYFCFWCKTSKCYAYSGIIWKIPTSTINNQAQAKALVLRWWLWPHDDWRRRIK